MGKLFNLASQSGKVQLGREEVGHFEQEQARERSSDEAVVYRVPKRSSENKPRISRGLRADYS